jgi:hypothetical protein
MSDTTEMDPRCQYDYEPFVYDEAKEWPNGVPAYEPAPRIIPDDEADRLIDRLASMDERQRRIKAQADAMIREIDNERKGLLFKHETDLREWALSKLKGKARSVKRLVGTCAFRTVPGRVVVTNPDDALAYCRQWLPEAIRETVDVKALQPVADIDPETGEIKQTVPTGCEWVPSRETFTVRGAKTEDSDDE